MTILENLDIYIKLINGGNGVTSNKCFHIHAHTYIVLPHQILSQAQSQRNNLNCT